MELQILHCPNCGGSLDISSKIGYFYCQYCGSKLLLKKEIDKYFLTVIEDRFQRVESLPILLKYQDLFKGYFDLLRNFKAVIRLKDESNITKKTIQVKERLYSLVKELLKYQKTLYQLYRSDNEYVSKVSGNALASILVWNSIVTKKKKLDSITKSKKITILIIFFILLYIANLIVMWIMTWESTSGFWLTFLIVSLFWVFLSIIIGKKRRKKIVKNMTPELKNYFNSLNKQIDSYAVSRVKFLELDIPLYISSGEIDDKFINIPDAEIKNTHEKVTVDTAMKYLKIVFEFLKNEKTYKFSSKFENDPIFMYYQYHWHFYKV